MTVVWLVTVVTVVTVVVVVVEPKTLTLSFKIFKESERKIMENAFCINSDDFLLEWSVAD